MSAGRLGQLVGEQEAISLIEEGLLPTKDCPRTGRVLHFYSEEKEIQKAFTTISLKNSLGEVWKRGAAKTLFLQGSLQSAFLGTS